MSRFRGPFLCHAQL